MHTIREAQSAQVAVSSRGQEGTLQPESLDRFPARLSGLWQEEGARPTRAGCVRKSRHWRTRKDPFEGEWCDVLGWPEDDLDTTAKVLLEPLSSLHPRLSGDANLRSLQHSVSDRMGVMARRLCTLSWTNPFVTCRSRLNLRRLEQEPKGNIPAHPLVRQRSGKAHCR